MVEEEEEEEDWKKGPAVRLEETRSPVPLSGGTRRMSSERCYSCTRAADANKILDFATRERVRGSSGGAVIV